MGEVELSERKHSQDDKGGVDHWGEGDLKSQCDEYRELNKGGDFTTND